MRQSKIVRTKIAEGTTFISVQGRSSNRAEVDAFTTELVKLLAEADRRTPRGKCDK